ncbi:MAG TPA: hypothetical protein VEV21_05985 [Burkholderiales bacterium]|jgi:hypothetical protein|nr:hypothetical protein [Burkholderiales bacterium]
MPESAAAVMAAFGGDHRVKLVVDRRLALIEPMAYRFLVNERTRLAELQRVGDTA